MMHLDYILLQNISKGFIYWNVYLSCPLWLTIQSKFFYKQGNWGIPRVNYHWLKLAQMELEVRFSASSTHFNHSPILPPSAVHGLP